MFEEGIYDAILVRRFVAGNPDFQEEFYRLPDGSIIRRTRLHYEVGDNRGDCRVWLVRTIPEIWKDWTHEDVSIPVRLEIYHRSAYGGGWYASATKKEA
jgi:hypothetical protein